MGPSGKLAAPNHNRVRAVKPPGVPPKYLVYSVPQGAAIGDNLPDFLCITKCPPPHPPIMRGEDKNSFCKTLTSSIIEFADIKLFPDKLQAGETVAIT